jgi:molecular chaperone Hsp33
MTTMPDDSLHRFQLERAGVRGAHVRLDAAWRELRTHGDYANALGELLGQALAASALFTSAIKFDGRLSVQLQNSGALKLLFAECTHDGHVRGIARWDGTPPTAPIRLDANANLAITIENRVTQTRYQGIVPTEGGDLATAFERYFERSEQLPTRIVLAQSGDRCAGILLQQIAGEGGTEGAHDADGWNLASHLLATLTQEELLALPAENLLLRLFHEDGVRLQPPQPLAFACSCSRERVGDMLRSLGRMECEETLAEQGSIQVDCEFCNRRYVFDAPDVAELFAAESPTDSAPTRH